MLCNFQEFAPLIQKGDVEFCIERVTSQLLELPPSPFHCAVALHFTNKPRHVARHFEKFISAEAERFPIKAVYAEMNGFTINPDRWFFDLFAYEAYGGHEEYDWLSEWQSKSFPELTLFGMEKLQQAYATSYLDNPQYSDAADFASLLVILKFQQLMKSSAHQIRTFGFPLLATAHDYDLVYEHPSGRADALAGKGAWWKLW